MKRLILSMLLATLWLLPLSAQESPYEDFMQNAEGKAVLYRGRKALSYRNLRFNGTYYAYTKDYAEGSVMFNGKLYEGILLNIDACQQQLLSRWADAMPEVIIDSRKVRYFTIGQDKYLNLSEDGYDAAPGFYKVLRQDDSHFVVVLRTKTLHNSADNVNGAKIGYDDPDYNPEVFNYFSVTDKYYVIRDGVLKKIRRRKALKMVNE